MKLRYEKCLASKVFTEPTSKINELYIELDKKIRKLENTIIIKLKDTKQIAVETISKLDTLSPLKTLTRGYAIAEKDSVSIKSVKDLNKDDIINLKFVDGERQTKVI